MIASRKNFNFFKLAASLDRELRDLKTMPASHWEKKGEAMVMDLFRYVYDTVPAYKKWLKKHKVDGAKIKTLADFKTLPVIDKANYLRISEYLDLFSNKDIAKSITFSATSGSTGEPFFLPRAAEQDSQYEYAAELFLKNQFDIDNKKTLCILGFGLGIWIGGLFTYRVLSDIARKGYSLSIIPSGPNKETYLKTLKQFAPYYDQVILMGYPPFLKDIVDEAKDYGINLKKYKIKILTAAEGFTEKFRNYLAKSCGLAEPLRDIINIYGTVEMGTMAHETALTNLIKNLADKNKQIFKAVFQQTSRMPTLAQYYPQNVYMETQDGEILVSGTGSLIPLLRYRFPDRGEVIAFDVMVERLKLAGVDIITEAKKRGIGDTICRLPFVYVHERSDLAVSFVGIILYPEYVKNALHDPKVESGVTGKFTMLVGNDKKHNQYLEVNIELRNKIKPDRMLENMLKEAIVRELKNHSTEYNYLYGGGSAAYRQQLEPRIKLYVYGDKKYFGAGTKQKWVLRSPQLAAA